MKKNIISGLAICILLAVIFGASYAYETGFFGLMKPTFDTYANEIIAECKNSSYKPACYDREIPKLMDKGLSMENAFQVTSIIQGKTGDYYYCHVLGHELASKETAKDPTQWTQVIARCPAGMCSNGCVHGAAQERFRAESLPSSEVEKLVPQIATICESGPGSAFTDLERASCYHSLGHLAMYMTHADIATATNICDTVTAKNHRPDFTQLCYEGAYMQIFQPLEPEDFALVKDIAPTSTQSASAFCDTFAGERSAACHRESWPLSSDGLKKAPGVVAFCSILPEPRYQEECYEAMFYVMTAQFNFDETKIIPFCKGFAEKREAQCFANSASRFIETDYRLVPKAAAVCKIADALGIGTRCYQELLFYSTYNFHKGSDGFNALCSALPEPWGTRCKNGEGVRVPIGSLDK